MSDEPQVIATVRRGIKRARLGTDVSALPVHFIEKAKENVVALRVFGETVERGRKFLTLEPAVAPLQA